MPSRGYRHQLTIERRTATTTGFKDAEDQWDTFATVRASVKPMSGSELVQAMQTTAVGTLEVRLRWSPKFASDPITTRDRIQFGVRTLHITHVANVEERNREVVLMCSEGE